MGNAKGRRRAGKKAANAKPLSATERSTRRRWKAIARDPEWRQRDNARSRNYRQKMATDPVKLEANRKRQRDWYARKNGRPSRSYHRRSAFNPAPAAASKARIDAACVGAALDALREEDWQALFASAAVPAEG